MSPKWFLHLKGGQCSFIGGNEIEVELSGLALFGEDHRVIIFKLKPFSCKNKNVEMMENGIAVATMIVERKS